MPLTLAQLINNYRNLSAKMGRTMAQDAVQVASDMNAQTTLRRIERGEDAEGSPFTAYSKQYAKKRKGRGRQTAHKDYTFTGQYNASVNPTVKAEKPGEVTVQMAARGNDNQLKAAGAFRTEKKAGKSDRAANINSPSDQEIKEAEKAFAARRENQIVKILT